MRLRSRLAQDCSSTAQRRVGVIACGSDSQCGISFPKANVAYTTSFPVILGGDSMKALLSMALVLGISGLAGAQDKANPAGTWQCSYKIGDQQRMSTLTITKEGDKLAGTMSWADQK